MGILAENWSDQLPTTMVPGAGVPLLDIGRSEKDPAPPDNGGPGQVQGAVGRVHPTPGTAGKPGRGRHRA